MPHLPSYPKVWNVGHPSADGVFDGEVEITEKVDGSQFSAGMIGGELCMRSKGADLVSGAGCALFTPAMKTFEALFEEGLLEEGWVYRGEAVCKPKHNAIKYDRAPPGGVILFDIDIGPERRLPHALMAGNAALLGLECVPLLFKGSVKDSAFLLGLLDRDSVLGGAKIEGVVAKNYDRFGRDGKQLMVKHVSEAFKERNRSEWKKSNPSKSDLILSIGDSLATEAKWSKIAAHLREQGRLTNTPKDIGLLFKELQRDIEEEDAPEIKDELWLHFSSEIRRRAGAGLAEWYKAQLLASAFKTQEQ